MSPLPGRARALLLVLALLVAAPGTAHARHHRASRRHAARAPVAPSPEQLQAAAEMGARLSADSTRALRWLDGGRLDSAHAVVTPLVARARTLRNPTLLARTLLLDAMLEGDQLRSVRVMPEIREASRLVSAARDTAGMLRAMQLEATVSVVRGDYDQAQSVSFDWQALAELTTNLDQQGWSLGQLGWLDLRVRNNVESAEDKFVAASRLFERTGNETGQAFALGQIGDIQMLRGDYAGARRFYERSRASAGKAGDVRRGAEATANLAGIDAMIGDPARAAAAYAELAELNHARGETRNEVVILDNLIEIDLSLGRVDEAMHFAQRALAAAESAGLGTEVPFQHVFVGSALLAAKRPEEAKAEWRAVLGLDRRATSDATALAALGLLRALAGQDSAAAALDLARRVQRRLSSGIEFAYRSEITLLEIRQLTRLGRYAEATTIAVPLARQLEAQGDVDLASAAWSEALRAQRRLGRFADAESSFARATRAWESGRLRVSNLESRERRGELAAVLMIEGPLLALDESVRGGEAGGASRVKTGGRGPSSQPLHPSPPGLQPYPQFSPGPPRPPRADGADSLPDTSATPAPSDTTPIAEALARLERFKTRTLLERMAGPQAFTGQGPAWLDAPGVTLGAVQAALRPDELLLEYACDDDTTLLFAVTRGGARVIGLPGAGALAPRVALAADLLANAGSDSLATRAATRELGTLLLGDVSAELARARRVLVAPDGPLHRVAFAALAPADGASLLARHVMTRVPSAAVLVQLRAHGARAAHGLLAVVGAGRRGEPALPGALREAGALARNYRDVTVWRPTPDGAPPALGRHAIVHFAGHAELDDQLPWRSGLRLTPEGADSVLTAASIATTRLDDDLIVLSSCQSAGGEPLTGEGVAGLAGAFLAAGVPAVVATLWPVEDAASERLAAAFYASLAGGATAAEALRDAQNALAARRETHAPFYWAGYVLIGDGGVRPPLAARPPFGRGGWLAIGGAALLVAAGLLFRRPRRDGPETFPGMKRAPARTDSRSTTDPGPRRGSGADADSSERESS
ncbi:MAG TPA: CHAT domain-containing protein [Candidatus Saccharimonadaceae bacterium]|nr:CHAT domain-containing protein [Candidatus Saccharimonadaceae bacterium]